MKTENAYFKKKAKKVHSVQYPDIHRYRISSYERFTTAEVIVMSKPKWRGLFLIYIYMILMEKGLQVRLCHCPPWVRSWGFMVMAHSTCMLRNRSPFFTPPCSILAPRLAPIVPSLKRQRTIRQWIQHTQKSVFILLVNATNEIIVWFVK